MENQGSVNPTSTTDYDDMGDLVYDDDDDDGGGGEKKCSCGVADDKDPSLSSEGGMDVDEEDNEESARREETSSNSKGKKRANEATDSSSSKKAKQTTDEDSRVLKNLIRELSIGSLKVSEVREKEGIFRLQQEVGNSSIFLTLYSKITNAEERHENSNQDVIQAYYLFGEALNRRLEHHKKTKEDHEARESVNDEVRKQLPKEVTKNALRKRTEKARKIYDLFRRIGADKIQRVRSFSASRIAKLSDVKVDYVVKEVIALL
ncbi:unnamed protein product [Rhizophagus irregularis]|nr:unnamed protein product [Rhizophagus irregularis]